MSSALRHRRERRKWMLFPLMDLFFIILLFFLVLTSGGTGQQFEEELGKMNRVPKTDYGRAQLLIQLKAGDSLLWIDNLTFLQMDWRSNWNRTIGNSSYGLSDSLGLSERLEELIDGSNCLKKEITAVLRCPPDVDLSTVINLEKQFDAMVVQANSRDTLGIQHSFHVCLQEGFPQDISLDRIDEGQNDEVRLSW